MRIRTSVEFRDSKIYQGQKYPYRLSNLKE